MVAKPDAPRVERRDERVGVRERLQGPLAPGALRELVGQGGADPLQQRGAQQHRADLRGLAVEHLGQEVAGDGPFAPGELRHEALGIRMAGERQRREADAGGPAFGPLVQPVEARVGQLDPGHLQQVPRLRPAEAQVLGPQLDELVREPQTVQAEAELLPRGHHHTQRRRQPAEEHLEQVERLGRAQLVHVVDDEHERTVDLRHVGQQLLDHRLAAKLGDGLIRSTQPSAAAATTSSFTTASQNRWASCSSRRTDTHAARSPAASSHERSRTDFPLPAGAQTTATPPGGVVDSRSWSSSRLISESAAGVCAAVSRGNIPQPHSHSGRLCNKARLAGTVARVVTEVLYGLDGPARERIAALRASGRFFWLDVSLGDDDA